MAIDSSLIKGLTEPLILHLVAKRPYYGYELSSTVSDISNGKFVWREGYLYPCLKRMEKRGWLVSEWQLSDDGKKRKYYTVTEDGLNFLKERRSEWLELSEAALSIFNS